MFAKTLVLLALAAVATANVPLVAWSSHSGAFPTAGTLRFGQSVSAADAVQSHLKAAIEKQGAIVVFLQNELSVSDLSKFSGSFNKPCMMCNLKEQVSTASSSLYMPSLSFANFLPLIKAEILARSGAVVEVSSVEEMQSKLAQGLSLVVFKLSQPTSDDEVVANDAVMQKALAIAAGVSEHVTGMFTAEQSQTFAASQLQTVEAAVQTRGRRDAPASGPANKLKSGRNPTDITYVSYRRSQRADRNYVYFTIPIFMALLVGFIVVIFIFIGVNGLGMVQTPERWADPTDKCLSVPAN